MVGKTPTGYDCSALVKRIRPDATGMTYSPASFDFHPKGTQLCWARYSTAVQPKTNDYDSCFFNGKLFEHQYFVNASKILHPK